MGQKNNGFDQKGSEAIAERGQSIQEHITAFESRIRRRLRGKFSAIQRGSYDLDDVLASTRRRVVESVMDGRVVISEAELEAYVWRIASRVAIDALRSERRERAARDAIGHQCSVTTDSPLETEASERLADMLHHLEDEERAMVVLRARQLSPTAIAEILGLSLEAYRSRWRRLRNLLRRTNQPPCKRIAAFSEL